MLARIIFALVHFAARKGLLPLIGIGFVILNFVAQFLPLGWLSGSDLFLHLGVILALLGVLLATGYPLEIPAWLHTDLGFALSWGGYPVLVGYWAQTRGLSVAALLLAAVATLLSLTQRALSTPARFVRRRTSSASAVLELSTGTETWERVRLLHSWERPLRLLAWGMAALAAALLAIHL